MKAIVENPLMNISSRAIAIYVEILNQITACENENELRACIKLLEKSHPEISNFFNYGFGRNHFWVSSPQRNTADICGVLRNSTTYAYISQIY